MARLTSAARAGCAGLIRTPRVLASCSRQRVIELCDTLAECRGFSRFRSVCERQGKIFQPRHASCVMSAALRHGHTRGRGARVRNSMREADAGPAAPPWAVQQFCGGRAGGNRPRLRRHVLLHSKDDASRGRNGFRRRRLRALRGSTPRAQITSIFSLRLPSMASARTGIAGT